MKKYKAVLFDFDGTLIDTNQYIIDSWKYMAEKVLGTRDLDEDYLASFFGTPLSYAMEESRKHFGIEDYSVDELSEIYRTYQRMNPDRLGDPFPGMKDTLFRLKEQGILLGIVTSRTHDSTLAALKQHGMDKLFDVIVGDEDTQIHKPLPEPCLICCDLLGIKPEDALMIGDSRYDIECGNNAGASTAFVDWSFCSKYDELSGDSKPDFLLKESEDILGIMGMFN